MTSLSLVLAATGVCAANLEYCRKAADQVLSGGHELAIEFYTRCIDDGDLSVGNLAISHNNRGFAYYSSGLFEPALRDFDRAIGLDPDYAIAYNNRCWTYSVSLRPEDALRDCNESLRIDPQDAATLDSRALAYWLLGDRDKARQDLERARRIGASVPTWQERFRDFEALF